jgi:subtilisin family serine protease
LGSNEKAQDAIFYSYNRHINGFAAVLDEQEAAEIAKHPDVVSVFENQGRKLHTTHSWDFLGLEKNGVITSDSIWKAARFGEDAIIGNLDTGVWPESKSFSDQGMGPIPSRWRGICQEGVRCNRKLIGARYFNKGYARGVGGLNSSDNTARDYDGHGSHTLSTAGGNFVPRASIFGFGNGTAKGGSPKARVASYKVCWTPTDDGNSCFDADIMAAFDAAITDRVDVLSVSLGGGFRDYFKDGMSIGAFHAARNGITVVCSAGNDGPFESSVANVSPWMITVAASTIDREYTSYVSLGNKKHIKGASLSDKALPSNNFYPLISAADGKAATATAADALFCKPVTLDAKKVKGKILICLRGDNARLEKGEQAVLAGAVGMILANDVLDANETIADRYNLTAAHVTYTDGQSIFAYINSTKFPMAYMTRARTQLGAKPTPMMALFSSKGPNFLTPEILKPDVTAPGVSIIAAFTEANGNAPFASEDGTSMSCPHISGIVGLLKTLHPDWSPAAIRSAIMTTAQTRDNEMKPLLNSSYLKATTFSYGAGHVRPNRAMDPGLVYDLTTNDYLHFLCALGYSQTQIRIFSNGRYACPETVSLNDFNYPSIAVPNLNGSATVSRTVKNVGPPGTYTVRVKAPAGISALVEPKVLKFKKNGEEKKFKVVLKANGIGVATDYVFGELIWSDGKHSVRSPIVVKAKLK